MGYRMNEIAPDIAIGATDDGRINIEVRKQDEDAVDVFLSMEKAEELAKFILRHS